MSNSNVVTKEAIFSRRGGVTSIVGDDRSKNSDISNGGSVRKKRAVRRKVVKKRKTKNPTLMPIYTCILFMIPLLGFMFVFVSMFYATTTSSSTDEVIRETKSVSGLISSPIDIPRTTSHMIKKEDTMRNLRRGSSTKEPLTNTNEKAELAVPPSSLKQTSEFLIPPKKWPVSVRDDQHLFEEIEHPAHEHSPTRTLMVPKFWMDGPLVDFKSGDVLMRRSVSMESGSLNSGTDENNPKTRTIFVMIASYRDWQCRFTVESIFNTATHPERVRVAVVDQIDKNVDNSCDEPIVPCADDPKQALCKFSSQIDVYEMDAILSVGPVFARHIGYRLYRGEYYAMQVDAHVTFVKNWDLDIIDQFDSTGNDMAVLSTYLTDVVGSIDEKTGKSLRNTRPIMCNTDYEGSNQGAHLRHKSQPEAKPSIIGSPQLQPYWAAGFSFARGHFLVNVPYDLHLPNIFQGEEISIGIRGFTYGYDFYAPEKSVVFHMYAHGVNTQKRNKVPKFWEHSNLYAGIGAAAMRRLNGIIKMNPAGIDPSSWDHIDAERYGLGKARKAQKFFDTFGIHVNEQKAEQRLCQFVERGTMHREFTQHLRADGMGIDYDQINYKFIGPH